MLRATCWSLNTKKSRWWKKRSFRLEIAVFSYRCRCVLGLSEKIQCHLLFCRKTFFQILLLFAQNGDIMIMANKLNIQWMGVFSFWISIPFFGDTLFIEFDKMQVPYRESCNIPNLYMVCLPTTGICVFVRCFQSAHFLFWRRKGGANAISFKSTQNKNWKYAKEKN